MKQKITWAEVMDVICKPQYKDLRDTTLNNTLSTNQERRETTNNTPREDDATQMCRNSCDITNSMMTLINND